MSRQIFLNDSGKHEITFEEMEGGATLVKGIPLMHPGHYQGRDYTRQYLELIAGNFAVVRARDAFEPAVLPRHSFDHEGRMTGLSTDEVMGHWKALYLDGDTLKGDAEILDEKDVANIRRGRARYWSTEIHHGYQLDDGTEIGPVIVGVASVTRPQIRAMPTQFVANSAEFADSSLDTAESERSNAARELEAALVELEYAERRAADEYRDAPAGVEKDKLGRELEKAQHAREEGAKYLAEDEDWAADKAKRMHDRLAGGG